MWKWCVVCTCIRSSTCVCVCVTGGSSLPHVLHVITRARCGGVCPWCQVDVELILIAMQHVGFNLRSDSPARLRDLIVALQGKQRDAVAASTTNGTRSEDGDEDGDEDAQGWSQRKQVMLDMVYDIKNNRQRTAAHQFSDLVTRGSKLRKWLHRYVSRVASTAADMCVPQTCHQTCFPLLLMLPRSPHHTCACPVRCLLLWSCTHRGVLSSHLGPTRTAVCTCAGSTSRLRLAVSAGTWKVLHHCVLGSGEWAQQAISAPKHQAMALVQVCCALVPFHLPRF